MLNIEVSDGNIEQLEEDADTPLFNKVFSEFTLYSKQKAKEEKNNSKTNNNNKNSRMILPQREDLGGQYWDTEQMMEDKLDQVEF